MSKVTAPAMLDATGQQIVEKLHTQNLLLDVIAGTRLEATENLDEIARIVRSGDAAEVFDYGDQIIVPWTDVATGKTYNMPWDVVHFGNVTLEDGEEVPGMYIQAHYAHPFGVQFSNYQAIGYYEDGLAAGTYYIEVGSNWGSVAAGTKINFTLTQDVPAGGQIAGLQKLPDVTDIAGLTVSSYADPTASNAIETVAVKTGEAGTSLGTLLASNDGALNLHRVAYGNNRYRDSAIRQYLNSDAAAGAWWNPQHNYDRPPAQLAQKAGFMSGFNQDFLDILKPTKIQVAANTVSDGGETDVMYDKFFLPSLQQMFIEPQAADVEGEAWEYWKRVAAVTDPLARLGTYPQMRTYALENPTSPQHVRLRSATRGYASYTWAINSSGYVSISSASYANRFAQAGVIC